MTFVGVCGGRDFSDQGLLNAIMQLHVAPKDVVVHGNARGADALADRWAIEHHNHVVRVPALWTSHGKSAGPRRNAVLAALPLRLLIVFPGGVGTADMVKQARAKGIPVIEASWDE